MVRALTHLVKDAVQVLIRIIHHRWHSPIKHIRWRDDGHVDW